LRTTDDGQNFVSPQIHFQTRVPRITGMFCLNESVGGLITSHHNNNGTHLYHSTDLGRTCHVYSGRLLSTDGWSERLNAAGVKDDGAQKWAQSHTPTPCQLAK
jgi:hypothetical protein